MTVLHLKSKVGHITHRFDLSGAITPVLHCNPPLPLGSQVITALSVADFQSINATTVGVGDELTLHLSDDVNVPLALEVTHITPVQVPLYPTTCPICGSPLHVAHGQTTCNNHGCSGQMAKHVKVMLAALGVSLQVLTSNILERALMASTFLLPTDIFKLELKDFTTELNPVDAQVLLTAIHAVRGYAGIDRVIVALDIPGWGQHEASQFHKFFAKHNYTLDKLLMFFEAANRKLLPEVNWEPWLDFIKYDTNRQYVAELVSVVAR